MRKAQNEEELPLEPISEVKIPLSRASTDRAQVVGRLAAGLSRELSDPTAYVLANLDELRRLLEANADGFQQAGMATLSSEMTRVLDDSMQGIRRIAELTHGLKLLLPGESGVVDVNEVARNLVSVVRGELAGRARVDLELAEVPLATGNASELMHVLATLCVAAAQLWGEYGPSDAAIRIATASDSECVYIAICDNGPGLFDGSSVTEDANARAQTLALAVARSLLRKIGGRVEADTAHRGARPFRIALPIARVPRESMTHSLLPAAPPGERVRMLLIDDEPAMRRALERALRRRGEVLAVTSGEEAIELLSNGLEVDLVISDLLLPGASGSDVFDFIEECRPELMRRILFLTGGALSDRARDFLQRHSDIVLNKPVEPEQLYAVVDAVARGTSVKRAVKSQAR